MNSKKWIFVLVSTWMQTVLSSPTPHILTFDSLPEIGQWNSRPILLGGFSTLEIDLKKSTSKTIYFRTITDRGPNGELIKKHDTWGKNLRPFLLADYSPQIVEFKLNNLEKISDIKTIPLWASTDKKISGLPPMTQTPDNSDNVEKPILIKDGVKTDLAADINGFDSESLCTDSEGRTWVSEEYLPSFAVFDKNKKLIQRFYPGQDFPAIFAERKTNRGFEAMTCDKNYLYVMLQSPIPLKSAKNKLAVRILRWDLKKMKAVDQLVYPLSDEKVDKIGDISIDHKGHFYVIEQNGKVGEKSKQYITQFKIESSNFISLNETPEEWDSEKLQKYALNKKIILDFGHTETKWIEKLEGLAVHKDKIFILSDNDFGLETNEKDETSVSAAKKPHLIWFDLPSLPKSDKKKTTKKGSK